MTRHFVTTLKSVLSAAALIACLAPSPARAQFEIIVSPPSEYIATTEPVYYEGHAAYWYGNRWYYRDGSAWRYYHEEPQYLHEYRGRGEPQRRFYGRGRDRDRDRGRDHDHDHDHDHGHGHEGDHRR